jgi:dihydroneopterin aldolase
MGIITIEAMEFFAYHGCFEEEQIIGNHFVVDMTIETDTEKAEHTDELLHTLDYQRVYEVVKKEMEVKSKLLEHIACRIADTVFKNFPEAEKVSVKVSKLNPPIGGKIDRVSVLLNKIREL